MVDQNKTCTMDNADYGDTMACAPMMMMLTASHSGLSRFGSRVVTWLHTPYAWDRELEAFTCSGLTPVLLHLLRLHTCMSEL